MSEEILKALMQLFAIISKQDGGGNEVHDQFVKDMLNSRVSADRVDLFFAQYEDYKNQQQTTSSEVTSVKDSVRTLAICKRINKTLDQKQKSIVLIGICEFIYYANSESDLRLEIVETIGKVFKIDKKEYETILAFTAARDLSSILFDEHFLVYSDVDKFGAEIINCKLIDKPGLSNTLFFCKVESANLILFRFFGEEAVSVNGLQVASRKVNTLSDGASIKTNTGSIFYAEVVQNFREKGEIKEVIFEAKIQKHEFKGGKVALRKIDITEQSGTLFGIMGGSGAGKTTLLNVLSGQEKSPFAEVYINGHAIGSDTSRSNIGYIPQDDLLFEELTVYQNLYYNAKLINPQWQGDEIDQSVNKVLHDLGLLEIKHIKVGSPLNKKISGGQRKRLNIALELIREPSVLFVDEPTSGLSSKDSENVMELLKLLAQSGKIIFVVIHQPSSDIFKLFDKLMILDLGGYPVYYGNPIESVIYFKTVTNQINAEQGECNLCGNVNPESIFDVLEDKVVDEYGKRLDKRKRSPEQWNQLFIENVATSENNSETTTPSPLSKISTSGFIKQIRVFFTRDFLSRFSDKQYLLIAILEAPVLALILSFIIRSSSIIGEGYVFGQNKNIPAYLFMLVIVALFIGLTISAEEIFKDQKILKREKFLRLSRMGYLTSKISYLSILSAIQALLLCSVGNFVLGIHNGFFSYWLMIFSVFIFGNLTGLILSSSFKSIVTIYIIIPLIIIPQMILGGAMFKYENLNRMIGGGFKVPVISNSMISKWAYEGLMLNQFTENEYETEFFDYNQLLSEYNYRNSILFPLIEDELNKDLSNGSELTSPCSPTVMNTLAFEMNRTTEIQELHLTLEDNSIASVMNVLDPLKTFYTQKYNQVLGLKDQKIVALQESLGSAYFVQMKQFSYNESVAEITQNLTASNKTFIENDFIYQNYDQVYNRDHLHPNYPLKGSLMFQNYKSLFGIKISTFNFNLIIIWTFNLLLFIVLYFNLVKKMINLF